MINTMNLSINYRLQKWTLAGVALICALTIIGAPSFLYSSEEDPQIEDAQASKSFYETHLPKEIYEVCLKQKLLDVVGEQQHANGEPSSSIEETDKKEKKAQKTYRMLKGMLLVNVENVREQNNSDGAHTLGIKYTIEDDKPYVTITCVSKTDDPVKGVVLGYRQGKLDVYALFDEKGRDYVAEGPFTNEHEIEMNNVLLDKILPIFHQKL